MDEHGESQAENGAQPDENEAARPDDPRNDVGAARTDMADLSSELGPPAELGTFPIIEAVLIAGRLRSVGIPALSESDVDDAPYRVVGGTSPVFVRPEDLERARTELQRIDEGAAEES
jgi:hypothetical protein